MEKHLSYNIENKIKKEWENSKLEFLEIETQTLPDFNIFKSYLNRCPECGNKEYNAESGVCNKCGYFRDGSENK